MKQYQYCYFNVLAGFFGKPFIDNLKPEEFKLAFEQGLYSASVDVLETLKEVDLYCIGEFDNVTGEIVPKHEFLAHVCEIASTILAKKGVPGDTNERKEN